MPITQSSIASNVISGATGPVGPTGATGITGATGSAPWVTSGSDIYYNAGNVGIGTSSPSEKLSVTGNVTATGTNTSATYFHRSIAPATESGIETSLITTGNGANQRTGLFAYNDYANTLATSLIFKTNPTTGNSTESIRIDSGGLVGIGTSSPDSKLHVKSTVDDTTNGLTLEYNLGTAYKSRVFTRGNDLYLSADTGNTGGATLFLNGGTERMRIDSAGRVTTPFRPGFVAHATGNSNYTSVSDNVPFPANATNYNQGSCYNTSNYRFTAPITGLYLFTFSGINNNTSSGSRPMFYVNGTGAYNGIQHGISNQDGGGSNSNATSSLIYLQANDYVFVASQAGSLYYYGSGHSTFSGCLIG